MIDKGKTILYIATSLDGYIAGPNDEIEWLNRYSNVDFGLKEFLSEVGAIIMGRRSYDMGVELKWFSQFNYGVPIFVISHDQSVPINKDVELIIVTKGIETAHSQAKSKARDKNVWIYGGATICTTVPEIGFGR